jgi:hypothetical protein
VNEYRAYVIGPDGHFVSCRAHVCPDDTHAITWATQLLDGRPVELWSGERFLIRLEPAE